MPDPRAEYESCIAARRAAVATAENLHIRIGNAKLAVVVAGIIVLLLWFAARISAYWLIPPAVVYAAFAFWHERVLRVRARAEAAVAFYSRGIARIDDRWSGAGSSGDRFRDGKHVYADDLDLFGRGSLFELLSAARLPMGEDRLAGWLLAASPVSAILERQALVAELRPNLGLREDLAVAGEELRPRFAPEPLAAWSEAAPVMPGAAFRFAAASLAVSSVATLILWLTTQIYWPFVATLAIEALVLWRWLRKAEAVAGSLHCNAEGLDLFALILARIERETFASPRLRELAGQLRADRGAASDAVKALARIVYWMDGRDGFLMRLLELPLLYTVQTVLAADAWRRRHGNRVRLWIESVAEMEALLSLAGYAFEHPLDTFPAMELAAGSPPIFDADDLGHPLIPAAQCVRNSLRLDGDARLLLISGSNMSGKSTLLRTVGINLVLAMAGAPVRAKSLRLSPLALGTRIRSADSLQEGRSNFYTEILRIREVFALTAGALPLLFLFDELLEGTNSKDRRIGAEGLLTALVARGAMGIVSTHDLALTRIAQSLSASVRNWHFQDYVEDGKMRFDYKLREGVVARSNALELMRLIGLDV